VSNPGGSETLQTRVKKCFDALDALDADAVSSFLAPGASVTLPGTAPILGREGIRKALVQFSLALEDLRHETVQLWTAGSLSIFEADMTLTLADRTAVSFPVTYIMRWVEGMIEEARVNIYLESRMALAMSAFDRLRQAGIRVRKLA
jgi:hypothetical protein